MENATKALLISAAVMIAIMVLSLLMMAYNQVSDYYQTQHTDAMAKQTEEFNNNFINYDRDNIRGSDLLSLMNKVIDFNERYSYAEGTNYTRIEVTIKIIDLKDFLYFDYDETNPNYKVIYEMPNAKNLGIILPEITNTKGGGTNREKDRQLIALTGIETELIQDAESVGIASLDTGKLETLSANIANIIIDEKATDQYAISVREKRTNQLKEILGASFTGSSNQIKVIKEITYQYYQFMQFKRAYFNSTGEFKIDPDTGRICGMTFEVSMQNGSVVFN